eukprot:542046-Prymnesium_polylepis.1
MSCRSLSISTGEGKAFGAATGFACFLTHDQGRPAASAAAGPGVVLVARLLSRLAGKPHLEDAELRVDARLAGTSALAAVSSVSEDTIVEQRVARLEGIDDVVPVVRLHDRELS